MDIHWLSDFNLLAHSRRGSLGVTQRILKIYRKNINVKQVSHSKKTCSESIRGQTWFSFAKTEVPLSVLWVFWSTLVRCLSSAWINAGRGETGILGCRERPQFISICWHVELLDWTVNSGLKALDWTSILTKERRVSCLRTWHLGPCSFLTSLCIYVHTQKTF